MGQNTIFTGREIKRLDKTESTNRYAHTLLAEAPLAEGYVVWALEQTEGRGQRGTSWISPPGMNLTFSLILHPRFLALQDQFRLTKAIALALAEFVSSSLLESHCEPRSNLSVKIKWPNDIYVGSHKIAGILIENVLEGTLIKHSVVGIGININQENFAPEILNATSLKILSGINFGLEDCLEKLCVCIEKYYIELRYGSYGKIDAAYHDLLYRRDIPGEYSMDGKAFPGCIKGVSEQGHLLIESQEDRTILEISDSKRLKYL